MMISRRDSNKNLKKVFIYITIFVVLLFLWSPFKSITIPILESVGFFSSRVYVSSAAVLHRMYLYVASNDALYQENVLLNNLLAEEKGKYLELIVLKDAIQKYENLTTASSSSTLFAKRIGNVDTIVHNTFRLNKGEQGGMRVGQLVVGPQNTLIGIVKEVTPKTALVSLLWNGDSVMARTSKEGTVLTLQGVDDGVYLALVPHEMNFDIGDVLTYDTDPRLIIGTVKKIKDNEGDRSKEIFVHIPFHPKMIDVVRIEDAL
jgi:cell shape-determining protein MreC